MSWFYLLNGGIVKKNSFARLRALQQKSAHVFGIFIAFAFVVASDFSLGASYAVLASFITFLLGVLFYAKLANLQKYFTILPIISRAALKPSR